MSVWNAMAAGVESASLANEQDFLAERDRLNAKLKAAHRETLASIAKGNAAIGLANELVKEIAAEEAGTLTVRRLSDPARRADRNQAFVATAVSELARLGEQYKVPDLEFERAQRIAANCEGEPDALLHRLKLSPIIPGSRKPGRG